MPKLPRPRKPLRRYSRVALIIETSLSYGRGLLRGIAQYARENGPWSIYLEQRSVYDPAPAWLKNWRGDGIISRAAYPELAKLVVGTHIPTVDLNEQVIGLGLPLIYNDHPAIGRLAAEHLIERGFRHYGFCGYPGIAWSQGRCRGFIAAVEKAGHTAIEYKPVARFKRGYQQLSWEEESKQLAQWVAKLPKPVGLMACNDFRAIQLLDACREADVAVPEEAAVIGVDNEDVACEMANPPLSSVVPDAYRIGYEAAAALDQMMHGKKAGFTERYIPPTGIVTRQSTDTTSVADPTIAAALRFIRDHAVDGIDVQDVLAHVPTSRSTLQRRFRCVLQRSIHDEIMQTRIRRAKDLLMHSDLKLTDVANRAGFAYVEHLSTAFKSLVGMPPGKYRSEHRKE